MTPMNSIQAPLLGGAPAQLVVDGEFVTGARPFPIVTVSETRLIVVRSTVAEISVTDGRLEFNRPGAGLNLNRFALPLPKEGGRVDYAQFYFRGWTNQNAVSAANKTNWRNATTRAMIALLETEAETYLQAIEGHASNQWELLGEFPLTHAVHEAVLLDTATRDAFTLFGIQSPLRLPQATTKRNRFLTIQIQSNLGFSISFSSTDAEAFWLVGWSPRRVNFAQDLASGPS